MTSVLPLDQLDLAHPQAPGQQQPQARRTQGHRRVDPQPGHPDQHAGPAGSQGQLRDREHRHHAQRPVTDEEIRFHDALANNESAVRELTDETLKKIAHELTEDLRKYKYPPDQQGEAIELVLRQAEALGEAWA